VNERERRLQADIASLKNFMREGHYESREELFWSEVMGGCGCGFSEDNAADVWSLFVWFREKRGYHHQIFAQGNRHMEVLAQWMDSLGLLDHGIDVAGSWLSPGGNEIWDLLHSDLYKPSPPIDGDGE